MRCFLRVFVPAVLALALMAAPARAADPAETHGGEHEKANPVATIDQGITSAITTVIVFLAVLYILSRTAWPKISEGLITRENKIRAEIEAAEQARQQARDALEQYQRSLAEARAESKRMLDETKAQQQALAAELRAKADAELAQMRDRARRDIEGAKRAAIQEIYTTSANLAADMAGKILRREWSPDDQQRLVEDSLRELQAKAM